MLVVGKGYARVCAGGRRGRRHRMASRALLDAGLVARRQEETRPAAGEAPVGMVCSVRFQMQDTPVPPFSSPRPPSQPVLREQTRREVRGSCGDVACG